MTLICWGIAYLLDQLIGDPDRWPHPVRWLGSLIIHVQVVIRRYFVLPLALRIGGGVLWLVVVGLSWIVTWGILELASRIHPLLSAVVQIWVIYTALAGRCLSDSAHNVERALRFGSLEESREKLSWIVGRDTTQLQKKQIIRAVVETVAENGVDGVIAPLFFMMLGGAPLMMAYKAVNTLDSMVGYKNEKYRDIGLVSARLDDVANVIPARLSWLLFTCAAALCRMSPVRAMKIGWRDRYQHCSPNCAWPEATVAGALGIRLGGPNVYFNERVDKPWIGDAHREVELNDIPRAVRLMNIASLLALLLFMVLHSIVAGI